MLSGTSSFGDAEEISLLGVEFTVGAVSSVNSLSALMTMIN